MSCDKEHVHIKTNAYICYDLKNQRTKFGMAPSKECVEHDGGEFKESELPFEVGDFKFTGLSQ